MAATTARLTLLPAARPGVDEAADQALDHLHEQMFRYASDLSALVERERQTARQLREALVATVRALGQMTESRQPGLLQHGARVGRRAQAILARLGASEEARTHALLAGLLHDAGVAMLLPPGGNPRGIGTIKLLRQHPIKSAELIAGISALEPLGPFILEHHETLDGSGYPNGLMGSAISLPGRVLAAAEMYEEGLERLRGLSSDPEADVLATVGRAAGMVLDREVVAALRASVLERDAV